MHSQSWSGEDKGVRRSTTRDERWHPREWEEYSSCAGMQLSHRGHLQHAPAPWQGECAEHLVKCAE